MNLEKDLVKYKEENKSQAEFISMIIHQLRTPLAGTKWTFKMLLDGDLGSFNDEQKQIIQKGYEKNEQIIKLLEEVTVANQNNSWDFQYDFKLTSIEPILESIIANFLEEARFKLVSIVLEHPASSIPHVMADAEKLSIVFQNLIENGIKYNFENGTLKIILILENDYLLIRFFDTGIGIDTEDKDKIFTEFFRTEAAKKHSLEGTGLGLFTAKKIIERHNGEIWFENEAPKGTTFYVKLPLSK